MFPNSYVFYRTNVLHVTLLVTTLCTCSLQYTSPRDAFKSYGKVRCNKCISIASSSDHLTSQQYMSTMLQEEDYLLHGMKLVTSKCYL
ncbi:hypothetical protein DVH24_011311 [Malus domestica]|uniref:Uncharacterized protein n=1 Tax=Malus domestica TaxID=3750 RepID=A0A498JV82_MALDO|nr:hypothetical protein DVH24_011311 [Malus domestica]